MVIRRQPTSHAFQTTQGKHQQRVKSLKCDVHSKPSPSVKQRYMRKLGYIGITYADKEPHGRDLSWAWPVMGVACLGRSAHEIKRKKKNRRRVEGIVLKTKRDSNLQVIAIACVRSGESQPTKTLFVFQRRLWGVWPGEQGSHCEDEPVLKKRKKKKKNVELKSAMAHHCNLPTQLKTKTQLRAEAVEKRIQCKEKKEPSYRPPPPQYPPSQKQIV